MSENKTKNSTEPSDAEFRKRLIGEFREVLEREYYELPDDTDGVVVISGPGLVYPEYDPSAEKTPEDREDLARIEFAVELVKQHLARQLGKSVDELAPEDFQAGTVPQVILDGVTEQLQAMRAETLARGIPDELVRQIDCGPNGTAHTKSQIEKIAADDSLRNARRLVFVSSGYHVPRLSRTAAAHMPQSANFDVIGVPVKSFDFDVYRMVRGEIQRIISYSKKGDIAQYPRGASSELPEETIDDKNIAGL